MGTLEQRARAAGWWGDNGQIHRDRGSDVETVLSWAQALNSDKKVALDGVPAAVLDELDLSAVPLQDLENAFEVRYNERTVAFDLYFQNRLTLLCFQSEEHFQEDLPAIVAYCEARLNPPADALLDPRYRAQMQGLADMTAALNGKQSSPVRFSIDKQPSVAGRSQVRDDGYEPA